MMRRSNPPVGGRRRRVFSLPTDKENQQRAFQSQQPHGVASRKFTNEELARLAEKFEILTEKVQAAAIDKWKKPTQPNRSFYFAPHNDLPQARKALSTFYRDHALLLLRERRHDGGSFISNKQIQQASWNLLLTSTGLSLPSLLDIVKTFLFHKCDKSGRLMDLLLDAPKLIKEKDSILKEDGSGLFGLVAMLQDVACNEIMESVEQVSGLSSKRRFDRTMDDAKNASARPSKRQRTATGSIGKENIYVGKSVSTTCYVHLPLALRLLWVHLGDNDKAVNFSSPRAVSLEEIADQLDSMKKSSMVFDAYEDALRLYSLERLLVYPEGSPLDLKTIMETQILSHQETAIQDLTKASGLPPVVVYAYCAEMIFRRNHSLNQAMSVCSSLVEAKEHMFCAFDADRLKSLSTLVCNTYVQSRILIDSAYPLYVYIDICLERPNNLSHCIFIANKMLDIGSFSPDQYTKVYQKIFMNFMVTNKLFDLDLTDLQENPLFQFATNSLPQGVDLFCSLYVSLVERLQDGTSSTEEVKYVQNACMDAVCFLLKTKYDREHAVAKYKDLTKHSMEHYDEIQKRMGLCETSPGPSGEVPPSFHLVQHEFQNRQIVDFTNFLCIEQNVNPETAPQPRVLHSEPIAAESIEVDSNPVVEKGHTVDDSNKSFKISIAAFDGEDADNSKQASAAAFNDSSEQDPEEEIAGMFDGSEEEENGESTEEHVESPNSHQYDNAQHFDDDGAEEQQSRASNREEEADNSHAEEEQYDDGQYSDKEGTMEEESRASNRSDQGAADHPEVWEVDDSDVEEGKNASPSPDRNDLGDDSQRGHYNNEGDNASDDDVEGASSVESEADRDSGAGASDGDVEVMEIDDDDQALHDDGQHALGHTSMQYQEEITEETEMEAEEATSEVAQTTEGIGQTALDSTVIMDVSIERAPSPEAESKVEHDVEVAAEPPQQQPVTLVESMDAGYEGGEENANTYAVGRMSYDSASQEDTSNMAAIESAKNASMLGTKFEERSEARSRQNFASDEGYEAEESQGHTEPEDDSEKPYVPKDSAEHSGYDAEESQEEEETRRGMPPPKDRTDVADGYYPTGDESQQTGEESQHSDNDEGERQNEDLGGDKMQSHSERNEGDGYDATGEESQTEEPPQTKRSEVLADGYYATAEDSQSQGGHTEEDDDPKVPEPVDGEEEEAKPLEVEVEESKGAKDSRHVEFAQPTRPSSQNLDDPGYMPDGHWTEDEAKGNKVTLTRSKKQEGYLGGESSGGENPIEENPTDLEDEESRRQDRKNEETVLNRPVQQRPIPADSQSISGMSAADDTMAGIHDEDGESSDEDDLDMDQRKVEEQPSIPALSTRGNTLQDFAAQAQGAQKPQSELHPTADKVIAETEYYDQDDEEEGSIQNAASSSNATGQNQQLEIIVEEAEDTVDNGALVVAEDEMKDGQDSDPVPGKFRSPSKLEDKGGIDFDDIGVDAENPVDEYSDENEDEDNPAPQEYRSPPKPKGVVEFDDVDENAEKPASEYPDNSDDSDDKEMEIESRENAMDIDEAASTMQLSPKNDSSDEKEMEVDIQEAQMEVEVVPDESEAKSQQDVMMLDDPDAEMENVGPSHEDIIEISKEDKAEEESFTEMDKSAEEGMSKQDKPGETENQEEDEAALNAAESLAALQESPDKATDPSQESQVIDESAIPLEDRVDDASETNPKLSIAESEEPHEALTTLDPIPEDDVVESAPAATIRTRRSARTKEESTAMDQSKDDSVQPKKDAASDDESSPTRPRTRRSTRSRARGESDNESVVSVASSTRRSTRAKKAEETPSGTDAPARRTRRKTRSTAESDEESVVSVASKTRRSSRLAEKSDEESVTSDISEAASKSKRAQTRKGRAKEAEADDEASKAASDEESIASSRPQRKAAQKTKAAPVAKRTRRGTKPNDGGTDDENSVASTSSKPATRTTRSKKAEPTPTRRSTRVRKTKSHD